MREIPLIEMDVSRREALEIALVENLQRVDLTPFEEAEGLNALVEQHGYTHERVASAVGRSRVSVTESLALLRLPGAVRAKAVELGVSANKSILLEVLKLASGSEMLEIARTDRRTRPQAGPGERGSGGRVDRPARAARVRTARRTPPPALRTAPDRTCSASGRRTNATACP